MKANVDTDHKNMDSVVTRSTQKYSVNQHLIETILAWVMREINGLCHGTRLKTPHEEKKGLVGKLGRISSATYAWQRAPVLGGKKGDTIHNADKKKCCLFLTTPA